MLLTGHESSASFAFVNSFFSNFQALLEGIVMYWTICQIHIDT